MGVALGEAPPITNFEAAKFCLRACLHWSTHARWYSFLREHPCMRRATAARPQLLWKLQRDYLQTGLPLKDKLAWLLQHHDWALRTLPSSLLTQVYTDAGHVLTTLELPEGPVELTLSACERFAKEGEWVLSVRSSGERVAALAFTVHRHSSDWCAHIGCLQGADGAGKQDQVRQATKALQGLRPKQAVVLALYSLLAALGVPTVLAVSNQAHIYQAKTRRRDRVQADYNEFWLELGGRALDRSTYLLPHHLNRKDLSEVPSKHRSQVRRRQALEDTLIAQIGQALNQPLSPDALFH
jgi:uncharacterized protein VirK/YbjX